MIYEGAILSLWPEVAMGVFLAEWGTLVKAKEITDEGVGLVWGGRRY